MAYSVIYELLTLKGNDNQPVNIGLLKRVLQELILSLPASPAQLESGANVPT